MLPSILNEFRNLLKIDFDKRLLKLTLFLGTYILAMFVTLIVIGIRTSPILAFYLVVFFPFSIIEFPTGLISILTQQFGYIPNEIPLTLIVVLGYLSVSLLAIFTKSKWVFRFFYFVFIILLIMNIAGCSISAPISMSNIN